MPRPYCCRHIAGRPGASLFEPAGLPAGAKPEVVMSLDEFESIRLADLDGLYQEDAAREMGISRPTFSRIVASARSKVADALVHGRALRIEGGVVQIERPRCCRKHDREEQLRAEAQGAPAGQAEGEPRA